MTTYNIPAKYRALVYSVFGIVSLVLSSLTVWYGAVNSDLPTWLIGANAVVVFVGAAIGYTARANVTREDDPDPEPAALVQATEGEQ